MKYFLLLLIWLFFSLQLFAEECPASKQIFKSDDGANEFRVSRLAHKHILMCGKIKNENDLPIYLEINSPSINFNWYYDRMIFKNAETGIEQAPLNCNSIRWITVAEGFYNDELTYIINTNTRGQSNCCTSRKYTEVEFQDGSFEDGISLDRIRWLSDYEANNLSLGYDPSEPELPKIQMYDGINFTGPILKLRKCLE